MVVDVVAAALVGFALLPDAAGQHVMVVGRILAVCRHDAVVVVLLVMGMVVVVVGRWCCGGVGVAAGCRRLDVGRPLDVAARPDDGERIAAADVEAVARCDLDDDQALDWVGVVGGEFAELELVILGGE